MPNKTVFAGKVIDVAIEDAKLPDGRVHKYEIVHHPGGSCMVPVFENGDLILLKQYRYPAKSYIWEIPAGKLDIKGEDPKECAARELTEEAGYKAGKIEKLIDFYTTVGFTDEILHIYKGTQLTKVEPNTEEHEVIEVHRFSPDEINGMLSRREIRDAKTLIGLAMCGFDLA